MKKSDLKLYRQMSEPFPDLDAANTAINGFFEELYELRKKYRMRDVAVVVSMNVADADGEEADRFAQLHIGDELRAESMAAFSFGFRTRDREALITDVIRRAAKLAAKQA